MKKSRHDNPTQKKRLLWRIILAAVLVSLLFIPGLERSSDRLSAYCFDLLHFPLFGILSVLLIRGLAFAGVRAKYLLAIAGMALLVMLVEVVQPYVGRSAEWRDLWLGLAGCLFAVFCCVASETPKALWKQLAGFVAFLSLAGSLLPIFLIMKDARACNLQFPLLGSFETGTEIGRWEANGCRMARSTRWFSDGKYSLQLDVIEPMPYPGTFLVEGMRNWRPFNRLCFDAFVPASNTVAIWVRLDDKLCAPYSDRVQLLYSLNPGSNQVCLSGSELTQTPGGRTLDLEHIISFGIFWAQGFPGDRLYIDNLRLLNES